ncbi:MAG: hypothetical protein HY234_07885 [Acidobacteria bacterium]|nr:hypothetical protein [Acidobacteriota bacterium]MBI3662950.1 hypothetical protein [Acidobacteriota bacterium]
MKRKSWPLNLLTCAAVVLAASLALPSLALDEPQIIPLAQIKPGMKGVMYTILAGDKIEAIELEVLGILPNTLGPKQDIILVVLRGGLAEHNGVVAGMSGSPVYIEGKLAGALSLRFGQFSKEAIGGVTPIQNIYDADRTTGGAQRAEAALPQEAPGEAATPTQFALPAEMARRVGAGDGAYLTKIDTPLVFSGFHPEVIQRFGPQFTAYGMVATQGGTAAARPDDAQLKAGDMVSMVLVKGDLSLQASCTVTAIVGDRVFVCGHPLFGYGEVTMPLARGRVVTTLASSFNSFKIVNAGGVIGSVTQDRTTAVVGRLGAAPRLIPVELTIATPSQEKKFRFEVMEHTKLTPLLVAIATMNGLVANTAYSEGMTFQLSGGIEIEGHSRVNLENMFAPTDQAVPDGLWLALSVQNIFTRIFTNPYERARIEKVTLRVDSIPERRWATIENAWSDKSEVSPGEPIDVKVLLRPYRGAPFMRTVPITIPAQAAKGPLRIVVSDGESLNRMSRFFSLGPQSRLAGLEQLITLMNRERRNSRLYVTLIQPTPTLLLEEKELPNAPISQINVLDQRRTQGSSLLLRESTAGEWSLPLNQVIAGQYTLTVTVK